MAMEEVSAHELTHLMWNKEIKEARRDSAHVKYTIKWVMHLLVHG